MAATAPFGFSLGAIQGGALYQHLPWIFGSNAITTGRAEAADIVELLDGRGFLAGGIGHRSEGWDSDLPWIFGSNAIICLLLCAAAWFAIPPLRPMADASGKT
jgi:hypothetical protein